MAELYPSCKVIFKSGLRVTQIFGINGDYYGQFGLIGHEGLDATPIDSTDKVIHSLPYKGQVVKDIDMADKGGAYGITNTVWYPSIGEAWQFCHMTENFIAIGQELVESAEIGIMGATGNTNGAHVHINRFKVDANGIRLNKDNGYLGGVDPLAFLLQLGGIMPPTMYTMKSGKQVDLSNLESNKVLADVFDEVINQGLWVKKSDVDAKIAAALLPLQEELKNRPVVEVIKEVAVEKIVEKVVEVIKEVPKEVIKEVTVVKEVSVPAEELGALALISAALKRVIEGRW